MKLLVHSIVLFVLFHLNSVHCKGIKEEFTWTRINYDWSGKARYNLSNPTESDSSEISKNENYIFENNIPMGSNLYKNKLFVIVPRRRDGIPSTVNYVNFNSTNRHNVPLIPYPNWEMNSLDHTGPDRLVSVYRVAIDPCERMWMVDTGIIEIPGNTTRLQPASVVIIDLKTDSIIKKYILPDPLVGMSGIANIVVDAVGNKCDNAYAYIPDLRGAGLIVYSLKENRAWKVNHNYFYLEPLRGDFFVGGYRYQFHDGVFSAGLTEVQKDGNRTLYFHAMCGTNMYKVSTGILKDVNLATRAYHGEDLKFLGDRGVGAQTSGSAIHQRTGIFFLGLVSQNALGCWNTKKGFKKQNFAIVQRDDQKMIYPSDVKISSDKLIVVTNRLPIFLYGKLDYNETNFRVWMNSVKDAVEGTKCM